MRIINDFNTGWTFFKNTDKIKVRKGGIPVELPHTWNALDGQDGGNDYFRGKCVYKKTFYKQEYFKSEKYYLEFEGVNSSCDVYLNEELISHHDGGYSAFRVDITDHFKEKCRLAVIVDNSPSERVYPQRADFTFYGGIYRNVKLIGVPTTHISLDNYASSGIRITPELDERDARVKIEASVTNKQKCDRLLFEIYDAENNLVDMKLEDSTSSVLTIKDVRRWDGKIDPYLYYASVSVLRYGERIDNVMSRFGCRSFRVDANGGFILNGRSYPLRGVSRHQDWLGIGNALKNEHHDRDMELILEVGADCVRLAHYQHSQYFYDLCDKAGIIVWAEIPYISEHLEKGNDNSARQLKELIEQNYNHPSIAFWGLSNEITMAGSSRALFDNHKHLNDLAHELDATRLTAIACVTTCDIDEPYVHLTDVVAYNHYFGWYGGDTSMNGPWFDHFHAKYPNKAIGVSEYGCEGLDFHSSSPEAGDYTEEYQTYYHEELIKQLFSRKYLFATFVWNMFDFGADAREEGGEPGQNHKGLVTMDRSYKKDAFYAYKAWLSNDPFVHICGKRYVDRTEDTTRVTIYSNYDEVELFVNGESLGKKSASDHFFYYEVENVGTSELLCKAGKCTDRAVIRKVDAPNEKYILKDKNAVLNWFDIEMPEGRLSLNSKISDIVSVEEGRALFEKLISSLSVPGIVFDDKMLTMMNNFTLLRFVGMLGMMNVSFSKEELLSINNRFNEIKITK